MFCSRCGTQVDTSTRFCPSCGTDLSSLTGAGKTTPIAAQPPQENETDIVREGLKDEYELEKELGRGGMAVVYKARDKQLDREVAIKVLPFSLSFDAEFVERFQREARTAGKLEHPNIIPIYRVGKSGRVIYFVMKFIRGKSLSQVIETRGALPVPEIKRFLKEATSALGYAHKHGIVHRDIKPDNIMFDELGQAIVADFGIAKAQSGAKLTGTGMSIGTPHYMSPEQARAQNLDGRSDIYSLGVVGYYALTGHVPFDGEDSFSIGYKHIMEELPVPALEGADQREIFQVVQKMMAKKPDDRYQSADELIAAIDGAGGAGFDMSNMRTLAITPLQVPKKAAPPPGATAPLPRASASMGKPKEAAAEGPTKASPARPAPERDAAPGKVSFKPKGVTARKSHAVPIGIAATLVLVGGGLGGYLRLNKKTPTPPTTIAANPPLTSAPPIDSAAHPRDSAKTAPPRDTAKAAATVPTVTAKRDPATSRTPTSPGTSRTPTNPGTSRTPVVTAPVVTPAGTTPATITGTIVLEGTIPPNAVITVDGETKTGSHIKVPAGVRRLDITAQGYQPYSNRVTVSQNRTQQVAVAMVRAAGPTPGPTPGPATVDAAVSARCQTPNGGRANARHECYDTPPNPNTTPTLGTPAGCTGTPAPVSLMVQVSAEGEVLGVPTVQRTSRCRQFDEAAVAQIQDITFTAARKAGRAVVAWRIIVMSPSRQ